MNRTLKKMGMCIDEFFFLEDKEKINVVANNGVRFSEYIDGEYVFDVYLLFNFIVSYRYHLTKDTVPIIIARDY